MTAEDGKPQTYITKKQNNFLKLNNSPITNVLISIVNVFDISDFLISSGAFNDLNSSFEATTTLTYGSIITISSKIEFHTIMGISTRGKPDIIPTWSFEKNRY